MNNQQVVIQKKIEQQIEEYNRRYFSPSKTTIRRWRTAAKRELNQKNQLTLPLVFKD